MFVVKKALNQNGAPPGCHAVLELENNHLWN
jgi:hypothetical protein